MVVAAASAATRSFLRSSPLGKTAWRFASRSKPSTSPFRSPPSSPKSLSHRIFRRPVELSAFLETMQPYHTVTASALMISKLTGTYCGYGWIIEDM